MKRIRRMSVEVIRRELSLSITRLGVVSAKACTEATTEGMGEPPTTSPLAAECAACRSPWLVLPVGEGEEATVLQRLLETQGIHHQMSTRDELLVCARSFELRADASDKTNAVTPAKAQMQRPATGY